MGQQIQVTEAQNAQLVSSMNNIKTALSDIISSLDSLSSACETLKGEGADALKEALTHQTSAFKTEMDSWDDVISQAKSIHDEIQKVDQELAK